MPGRVLATLFAFIFFLTSAAQSTASKAGNLQENNQKVKKDSLPPPAFKPVIGLGAGVFSFFGDLYSKQFADPSVSRIGYDLSIMQMLSPAFGLKFYVLFGKLGANERSLTRNINFQSEIRTGGIHLMYNFDNLLKPKRNISPFISLGFESFEFLSKTDLYDAKGNKYHYWSDGSIRNVDETSPLKDNAITLIRDYTYESDIRELNIDDFGKYPERSFAVPVGVGAILHMSDRMNFQVGSTLHFTFTDFIDGITANSIGTRKGDGRNDRFVMTSFALKYNIFPKKKGIDTLSDEFFNDVDFFALDKEDMDKDGVTDPNDECMGTPPGVKVDAKGCPLDSDKDGIADYLDKEVNSKTGAVVDATGMTLTDAAILARYKAYIDSTGDPKLVVLESQKRKGSKKPTTVYKEIYTIFLGEFKEGLAPELMSKFLSIPDIESITVNDSITAYSAGRFTNLNEAKKRKEDLTVQGFERSKIVIKRGNKFVPVTTGIDSGESPADKILREKEVFDEKKEVKTYTPSVTEKLSSGKEAVVFRVQLGAYRNKISKNTFGVDDVLELQTPDGYFKYVAGSYKTFDEAAKRKVSMTLKGFPDAFVVAYKSGKRIDPTTAGATPSKPEPAGVKPVETLTADNEAQKEKITPVKDEITFKVQVGVFKNEPPADIKAKFSTIKGLEKQITSTGLTRYTAGSFKDYNSSVALKNELKAKGIDGFVIAFLNDQYISIQEALELLK